MTSKRIAARWMSRQACLIYKDDSGLARMATTQFLQEVDLLPLVISPELVKEVRVFRDEELMAHSQFEFPTYASLQDHIQREIQSLDKATSLAARASVASLKGLFAKLQVLERLDHLQLSPKS